MELLIGTCIGATALGLLLAFLTYVGRQSGRSHDILSSCWHGNCAEVRDMLKVYPFLDHTADNNGLTPLHIAAMRGHIELLTYLLQRPERDVNIRNNIGMTPLHLAAMMGRETTIRILIDNDAEVDARDERNTTPLHLAAWDNHIEAVQALLEHGADVYVKNLRGDTALSRACHVGHREVVELLVAAGADAPPPPELPSVDAACDAPSTQPA